jgi:regulatory protein
MNSSNGSTDEIENRLPLTITSISVQKKRTDRFSLFHEKEFLIGVSAQTLLDYSIKKGSTLTHELYLKIQHSEDYQKIKDAIYVYLSGRDHATFELKQKVMKKGFDSSLIESVLDEFDQKGLLDDENFARKFATDKAEFKNWGPNKIKSELIKKGISKKIAEKVVQKLSDSLEQDQICVDLLRKRKQHFLREEDPLKRKQKMFRYLAGKGYHSTEISKATDIILKELNA